MTATWTDPGVSWSDANWTWTGLPIGAVVEGPPVRLRVYVPPRRLVVWVRGA